MDWDKRFRDRDTPWQRPGLNPGFAAWFEGPRAVTISGLDVLIPGFGASPEPLEFARRGACVTGIDIAPSAVAFQRQALADAGLAAEFALAGIGEWRPSRPVDLIYEQTCLCAIDPADRVAYEDFAHAALKPGGRLFALFMQNTLRPGGPPFHCDLAEMRKLFAPERWTWPVEQPVKSDHPNGMHELGQVLTRRG